MLWPSGMRVRRRSQKVSLPKSMARYVLAKPPGSPTSKRATTLLRVAPSLCRDSTGWRSSRWGASRSRTPKLASMGWWSSRDPHQSFKPLSLVKPVFRAHRRKYLSSHLNPPKPLTKASDNHPYHTLQQSLQQNLQVYNFSSHIKGLTKLNDIVPICQRGKKASRPSDAPA
jgi:hypothetical protein